MPSYQQMELESIVHNVEELLRRLQTVSSSPKEPTPERYKDPVSKQAPLSASTIHDATIKVPWDVREVPKVLTDFEVATRLYDQQHEYETVNPPHYTQGKIEVIDFIEDQQLGFLLGNVIKYVCRSPHKGTRVTDLKKALWYLQREIKQWTT